MEQQEQSSNPVYTISINNQNYRFSCTDGEAHVRELEKRINEVVQSLSAYEKGHKLTDYAMKIVLLLADNAVRASYNSSPELIEQRLTPLIEELDRVTASE